ncbi:hypothetical protein NW339_13725 [Escherichia coli]|nr:hypothetical protein NW339_13725 [Escherichia coli]
MTMFTQRETRILDQARDIISRYYQRGVQRKRKLTAVCSHQTRIGNLDAHLI